MHSGQVSVHRRQVLCWLIVIALPLLAASAGHAAPSCQDERAPNPATGAKYQMEMDDSPQAPGGTIVFTITGLDPQKPGSVAICLRRLGATTWSNSKLLEAVRVAQPEGKTGTKFAVTIPWEVTDFPLLGWRFYPPAQLRVTVSETSSTPPIPPPLLDVVREMRISPMWFAVVSAVVFVVVVTWALYRFALFLGVPGTGIPLRIISTANGWASLSQFQIILWTLVIGAGAVYVMTLRGTLIDISAGTLALLGIAGAATVGSQLKSSQESQGSPAAAMPGPVTNLGPEVIDAREVTLSWRPPTIGGTTRAYIVQFRRAGVGNWLTATTGISTPRFRLVGLTPDADYDVRVIATNTAGPGPDLPLAAPVRTGPAPALPQGVPDAVAGLAREGNATPDSITLQWPAPAHATGYTVEYRVHDSDGPWQPALNVSQTSGKVSGLRASTTYDFRVIATNAAGAGQPSNLLREATGTLIPRWSDIVTNTDRPAEIDVTRVQMLFFTVISACFVAQKIAFSGTIPEIPPSYVTLMGISNGVYLTSKFAAR